MSIVSKCSCTLLSQSSLRCCDSFMAFVPLVFVTLTSPSICLARCWSRSTASEIVNKCFFITCKYWLKISTIARLQSKDANSGVDVKLFVTKDAKILICMSKYNCFYWGKSLFVFQLAQSFRGRKLYSNEADLAVIFKLGQQVEPNSWKIFSCFVHFWSSM